MTRLLTLVFGLAATVGFAQSTTSSLVLPGYAGTFLQQGAATANEMWCWTIPAPLGITNATKMAGSILVQRSGTTPTCKASWIIYPDSDVGTKLAALTANCDTVGIKSTTGLSPFSLVQGTRYRFCFCNNRTITGGFGPYYLAVAEYALTSMQKTDLFNATDTSAGIAADACVDGAPPVFTGAITPFATGTVRMAPMMLVETP